MTLLVIAISGLGTVQDLGRRGHMHEGVSPGGALVPALLIAANRRVGNRDDAAAIEILGAVTVQAEIDITVALATTVETPADTKPMNIPAGDGVGLASATRVTYLAIRGGVDAPKVLGSRGTLLSAGIGKRLARGDRIACASELRPRPAIAAPPHSLVDDAAIRIVPGPDSFEPDALTALLSSTYRIHPNSDRVGVRLEGTPLPHRPTTASRPMVIGAIEVPGDGQPIVLGPDHPTTGGYPIVGVIAHTDLARFFARPLGGTVRFVIG